MSVVRPPVNRREWSAIVGVLLLAFALRTIDLARVPPGLHNDEVVAAKLAEAVMNGHYAIFYPQDTGSEPLHYFFSGPIMSVLGSSVWALRLPSIALSLLAMCIVWALARRLFGPVVALVALAGFAVTFWTVEFGRIVSPVVMMVPLVSLSAYLFWRAIESPRRAGVLFLLSGVALGAAILSYTAPRIIPIVYVAFGGYVLITRRAGWRRWLGGIAVVIVTAGGVAAPMLIYLAQHPEADQLDFFDIDRPVRELRQGNLEPVLETSLQTLGMFAFVGDPLPYYDVPDRPVLEPIGAVLLLIGLLVAAGRWRQPAYAFIFLWFFLSLAPGMLSQPAPNYTRTLGVQTVLFTTLGIGVSEVVKRFNRKTAYAGMALLFVGNLIWTTHDYFTVWPSNNDVRFWHQSGLKAVADQLQRDPDTSPVAICLPDRLIDERDPWWKPAWQHMRYLLHRDDVRVRYYNCEDTIVLIDGAARYAFPDAADAAALSQFPIDRQFLETAQADRVQLPDRLGVILRASLSFDQPLSTTVAFDGSHDQSQAPIDFGGQAQLLGYTISTATLKPGASFDLTTYWRVTAALPPQVSQFTHVLSDQDEILAQDDRLMLTSQSLQPGDVFAQIHHLVLPDDAQPGEDRIAIGLYTQPDGKRLTIRLNGQPQGARLFLPSIDVKP